MTQHLPDPALLAGLRDIEEAPKDQGRLDLIVIRPRDRDGRVVEAKPGAATPPTGEAS